MRVVLMSATLDARKFAGYFGPAAVPCLEIPGFTHPVRELYLEDVLALTGTLIGRGSPYALSRDAFLARKKAMAAAASQARPPAPSQRPTPRDPSRLYPRFDRIFPGDALNPFFGARDEGFSEFRSA